MADESQSWKTDFKWAIALLFIAVLSLSGWYSEATWACPVGPQEASTDPACANLAPGQEDLLALTVTLLEGAEATEQVAEGDVGDGSPGQVVALEALAVLLVAALVGSIVIAIREPEGGAL